MARDQSLVGRFRLRCASLLKEPARTGEESIRSRFGEDPGTDQWRTWARMYPSCPEALGSALGGVSGTVLLTP